jgi:hypothetical protein
MSATVNPFVESQPHDQSICGASAAIARASTSAVRFLSRCVGSFMGDPPLRRPPARRPSPSPTDRRRMRAGADRRRRQRARPTVTP